MRDARLGTRAEKSVDAATCTSNREHDVPDVATRITYDLQTLLVAVYAQAWGFAGIWRSPRTLPWVDGQAKVWAQGSWKWPPVSDVKMTQTKAKATAGGRYGRAPETPICVAAFCASQSNAPPCLHDNTGTSVCSCVRRWTGTGLSSGGLVDDWRCGCKEGGRGWRRLH